MATLDRGPTSGLLHDLHEKKQDLRRIAAEVGGMAAELREMRSKMSLQESSLEKETARRQAAEDRVRAIEMELEHLKINLDEKNARASSTATVAEQYLRELIDVRIKLGSAQEVAETNAMAAAKAETQCMMLMKEIEAKNEILQEHDAHVAELTDQLTYLQQEINTRELHQKELKEEVLKLEREVKLAALRVAASKDLELKRVLEEISIRNSEQLSKLVNAKDDEISRMKEEIRLLSAQLRLKAQELETQVEKHRAADQELKKRVVKLEFWLQEARNQTRKFQKIVEKREKELKDLQAQLASNTGPVKVSRSVWNDQRLKVIMSITVVVLALFARH